MINTLPSSLIASADIFLRNNGRIVENFFVKPPMLYTPLNGDLRNDADPIAVLGGLTESISPFHEWAMETEHKSDSNLPVDAYYRYGNPKDDAQMAHRAIATPMSHPDLFKQHYASLSPHEKKTVHDFIHMGLRQNPPYSSGSVRINTHLIGAHKSRMTPNPMIKHHNGEVFDLHAMDGAITKCKLPKLVTYTGISFDPAKHIEPGGVISSPALLSSSTRRYVAGKYAFAHTHENNIHHNLEIKNENGHSGVYVGNRTPLSEFSDDEVIIPRNERLFVNSTRDIPHNDHIFRIWSVDRTSLNNYIG